MSTPEHLLNPRADIQNLFCSWRKAMTHSCSMEHKFRAGYSVIIQSYRTGVCWVGLCLFSIYKPHVYHISFYWDYASERWEIKAIIYLYSTLHFTKTLFFKLLFATKSNFHFGKTSLFTRLSTIHANFILNKLHFWLRLLFLFL